MSIPLLSPEAPTADRNAAANPVRPAFAQDEYRRYLAGQMQPLIRALMVVALLAYGIGVALSALLHATQELPVWLRLAPMAPLLMIIIATAHARQPWVLSSLTLGCLLMLEVGINLSGAGHIVGASRVIPGLLLPVVCSMVWLGRWDFAVAMVLCAIGPLPALLSGSASNVMIIQYSVYMTISIVMATVLRTFMTRTLRAQFRLEQKLRIQATTDGLTGLLSRNRFLDLAEQALQEAEQQQQPLCLAFLDVDHFKPLNDNFGHAAGDAALTGLSTILRAQMRRDDLIGRIGGEEFAVLLPGIDLQRATVRADELREAAHAVSRPDGRLTISIGLAQFNPGQDHVASLMARADRAMRYAKLSGRDCVITAADA